MNFLTKIYNQLWDKVQSQKKYKFFLSCIVCYCTVRILSITIRNIYQLGQSIIQTDYHQILGQKYGIGTWAIITGGSMGIGLQFANELAKAGFNIVIISNETILNEQVCMELEQKYKINTLAIYADFSQSFDIKQNVFSYIKDKTQGLDISILINNAAVVQSKGGQEKNYGIKTHSELNMEVISLLTNINMLAPVYLFQTFLPQLLKRKSMVINVSSVTADLAIKNPTYTALYGSSKYFVKGFTRYMQKEYEHQNIDFFCLKPGGVATRMLRIKQGGIVISPEMCAKGALNQFSKGVKECYGHYVHEVSNQYVLPIFFNYI